MSRLLLFVLVLSTGLASCGGGGGGSNSANKTSGVAIDGYLKNARAFLDMNSNGVFDLGEPNALTDANGGFSLTASQADIEKYSVVISVIANSTIDQDSPNTPITAAFTMIAPPGKPSVVSPLTTHIVAKMSGGLSQADAETAVKTELGLTSIDIYKNYVEAKASDAAYAQVHNLAAAATTALQNAQAANSGASYADILQSYKSKVTNTVVPRLAQIKAASTPDGAKQLMPAVSANGGGSNTPLTAACNGICVKLGVKK